MAIRISTSRLERLTEAIFLRAGFLGRAAGEVARHLVEAEAAGVASHGINRVAYYLSLLDRGMLSTDAEPALTRKTEVVALVDGNEGLGIPAANLAVEYLVEAARSHGVAAAGLFNCGHTGRMGAYAETAADAGCVLISFGGAGRRLYPCVVPFGSREPFFSTNPFSIGAPGGRHSPAVLDIAASIVAGGKVAIAKATGQSLPDGYIVDKAGNPSTDPDDYIDGGALLPFGGVKGSGLGLMAELITTAMMGEAFEFNWLFLAVKADVFRPRQSCDDDADTVIDDLHGLNPASGFDRVRMPGEVEAQRTLEARSRGLDIADGVWAGLVASAERFGIDVGAPPGEHPG